MSFVLAAASDTLGEMSWCVLLYTQCTCRPTLMCVVYTFSNYWLYSDWCNEPAC